MMQTVIPPHFFTDPSLHIQPQSAVERDALNQRIDETLRELADHFRETGGLTNDIIGTLRGIFLAIAAENGKVDSYGYYTDPVGLHKPKRKYAFFPDSFRMIAINPLYLEHTWKWLPSFGMMSKAACGNHLNWPFLTCEMACFLKSFYFMLIRSSEHSQFAPAEK